MARNTPSLVGQVPWIAFRAFVHDRKISLCFILALVAVLAPLLVLFGLKFGLVETLTQRLVELPQNREIIGVGTQRTDDAWFERMAVREDVAFVIPSTRRIAASFSYLQDHDTGRRQRHVQMIPTGEGDPLLGDVAIPTPGSREIVVSAPTAGELSLTAGRSVIARIDRRRHGRDESATIELQVVGISPEAALPADGVFVPLSLLVATEDYRDGVEVAEFGWAGNPAPTGGREYPRFRLYASTIYDVAGLRDALVEAGHEVRTRSAEIETMQGLDRNLDRVFWLVAVVGGAGFLASLAASLVANVERQKRNIGVVRIIGYSSRLTMLFPVTQSVLIAVLGTVGAAAIYVPVASLLNRWFASSLRAGEFICQLHAVHFGMAFAVTMIGAVVAAGWAAHRVVGIQPAEAIRDV